MSDATALMEWHDVGERSQACTVIGGVLVRSVYRVGVDGSPDCDDHFTAPCFVPGLKVVARTAGYEHAVEPLPTAKEVEARLIAMVERIEAKFQEAIAKVKSFGPTAGDEALRLRRLHVDVMQTVAEV